MEWIFLWVFVKKKMLDTSGGATPAVEGSGLATSAPAENHGIPSAEAQDSQPPPQDMDSPNSPSGLCFQNFSHFVNRIVDNRFCRVKVDC